MNFVAKSLPPRDRDDDRGVPTPPRPSAPVDLFTSISHDLFVIGALYRVQGVSFNRALSCCQTRKAEQLNLALACVRANAQRIADLTKDLEGKLVAVDDFENSPNVYGA